MQINHDVTPDSELLLHAAREVVEEEGFDQQLDDVRDRVDEIESLHRTRELTVRLYFASFIELLLGLDPSLLTHFILLVQGCESR